MILISGGMVLIREHCSPWTFMPILWKRNIQMERMLRRRGILRLSDSSWFPACGWWFLHDFFVNCKKEIFEEKVLYNGDIIDCCHSAGFCAGRGFQYRICGE